MSGGQWWTVSGPSPVDCPLTDIDQSVRLSGRQGFSVDPRGRREAVSGLLGDLGDVFTFETWQLAGDAVGGAVEPGLDHEESGLCEAALVRGGGGAAT